MATYEPPLELFERQLDSIRAQTARDWVCVISDDGSEPERFARMRSAWSASDPRFLLLALAAAGGFYRNFERALSLAPAGADYVALADQDDRWHPDKLARSSTRSATCSSSTATARGRRRGRAVVRHVLERGGATATTTCSRCSSPTR